MASDPEIPAFTGTVTRLTDGPLIAESLFGRSEIAGLEPDALANINGPSLLRMPDWAPGRRGAYHLYFAHHKGRAGRSAFLMPTTLPGPGGCTLIRCFMSPTASSSRRTRCTTPRFLRRNGPPG